MSEDKKSLINLIPEALDNAAKNQTNQPTQNIKTTLADIWYLVFGGISQVAEKRKIKYHYALQEFEKELQQKLYEIPNDQITQPDIQIAKQILSDQIKNNPSLLQDSEADKIQHYLNIYQTFQMESISHVTSNKCIVDPLGNPISNINNIRIDVSEVNDWMLNELKKNPTDLYQLSSRRFEELVAEIFIRKGYDVELTPATRDGGKDIYIASKNDLGSFLYIVECKKYKSTHKVGVNVLRDLYGVLSKERATYGIAVTTSYFSKPAKEFQQELQFQMSLKDFDSIKQWLYEVT